MKRITAIALFALATLVAGSAMAQEHAVKANVPFDFTVGNAHVPAGTYTISSTSTPAMVELRNASGKVHIFGAAYASGKQPSSNKLVFDKYGDRYFLHEIRCSTADTMNVDLPVSKSEKWAQKQEASLQQNNKDEIFVALAEIK